MKSQILMLSEYRAEEQLADGRTLIIRAMRPGDKARLIDILRHLSPDSMYMRFLAPRRLTPKDLVYFTEVDFTFHVALIAEIVQSNRLIPVGSGRFIRDRLCPEKAEVALTVEDRYQREGIGCLLFLHLVQLAKQLEVKELYGVVLRDNLAVSRMLKFLQLEVRREDIDEDTVRVSMQI